jgi:Uma2 family endonuclease
MGAVSIADAWPATGRPFTVADLDRIPDDGRRYELVAGVLVVSPRPTPAHQVVAFTLASLLAQACPDAWQVVPEPAVLIGPDTELVPDVVVAARNQLTGAKITEPPVVVAEVRSPSTALIDLNRKKVAYERFGVGSYWVVVPEPAKPALVVFELNDGRYQKAAHVHGEERFAAVRPFRAEVVPAQLVAGLRSA